MSQTPVCWKRSPSAGATAVWSLAAALLLAAVSTPLQACDGGTAVPDPGNNAALVADCEVLIAIRDELAGSDSLNWDTQLAMSSWQGIGVSGSPSRVATLGLGGNQLTGTIPAQLGQLNQLKRLDLGGNQLTGPIPVQLGQLNQLEELGLGGNQLTGPIPVELSQLSQLQYLSLSNNQLTGPIPAQLGQLNQLERLDLGRNQLTGPIPVQLGQLNQLEELYLSNNQLTGEILVELSQLYQLRRLYLSSNQLTGEIPVELGQLNQLQRLYLPNNQLTGEIPVELAQLYQLRRLYLSSNQLTGEIPVELSQLSQLERLDLSSNQLTGEIPVWLSQLYQLQVLSLRSNQLTGEIPVELSQLSQLQQLTLSNNQLTGEIPVELSQLSQLRSLWLYGNQLTGEIPVELAQLYQLRVLSLRSNQLTGPIPVELSQLYQLRELYLYSNQLTGPIPAELAQLSQLQALSLDNNQLTGEIPVELSQLSQLRSLRLDNNQLTGPIPAELAQLSQLQALSLDNNQLTGPIPAELAQLSQLQALSLDNNQLTGPIPAELGNLAQLNRLYLHGNELNGPIPSWLVNLTELRELSLWNNQLTGTIPPEVAPAQDRAALVVLYLQTDGPNWTDNTKWARSREPLSEWHGVSTDEQGRVEELRLSTNGLNGTIGAELGVLTRLTGLYLNDNELTGTIPPELENLTQLQVFDIRNTGLCMTADSELHTWIATIQDFQGTTTCEASNLVANFSNGNNGAFNSRVYLWNPSESSGDVTVRVFTLPLTGGLAQELTTAPLNLGTLGAKSALNVKVAEDILDPLGIALPYTNNEGDLTLEFTIQAVDVRGATQVFSSSLAFGTHPLQEIPSTSSGSPTVLVANFMNGNSDAFSSRAYLFNPSASDGNVTVRVFTLPLSDGTAQELTGTPLDLGTLEARSALNLKLVEDILTPLGITTPYTTGGGNLTLEFTIQAAAVRGAAQVFSSSFAFGVYPLQEIPSTSSGSPTVLVANFMNGNSDAFSSRAYLFNPSDSDGNVTVRVFTLPLSDGAAQELTVTPLDLGTLEARLALNLKLAEDILIPLGIALPYVTDGGNLTLEFTIQAADARGAAQVFSSDFAFGTYPMQEIPSTSSGSPTVLVANFMNGNDAALNSRVYLWNPSLSAGSVTVRVFTLPLTAGVAQELTTAPLDLGTLGAESARNLKLVEDILTPLGIPTPYVTDGGNLTLEFTIQAADVRGAAQVFSSSFAFGTVPLQVIQ